MKHFLKNQWDKVLQAVRSITHPYSLLAIVLYAVVAFTHRDSVRTYNHIDRAICYDMGGYYAYMPAWFINGDYSFEFMAKRPQQAFLIKATHADGSTIKMNKYSIGPALMASPFFLIGHLEAYIQQVPQDGFSYTYLFWIVTGCIIYTLLAFFALRWILLKYFKDLAVATTILALGIGTNLLHYTTYDFMMSHTYSFSLFCWVLFLMIKWLDQQRLFYLLSAGFLAGILGVTRLPNLVFLMVPAFWAVNSRQAFVERLQLYWKHKFSLLLVLVLFIIPFLPQFWYWHYATGLYLTNPYSSNNEGFYWLEPMLAEILIGYRKGWLIYTPMMIFAFIGFISLYKKHHQLFPVLFTYALISLYLTSAWGCWWYGGSFGMRALVECSVAFAVPMAAFFHTLSLKSIKTYVMAIFVVGFAYLNMFQSSQYYHHVIHYDAMSRKAYWTVFLVAPPASPEIIEERNKHLESMYMGKGGKRLDYKQTIW